MFQLAAYYFAEWRQDGFPRQRHSPGVCRLRGFRSPAPELGALTYCARLCPDFKETVSSQWTLQFSFLRTFLASDTIRSPISLLSDHSFLDSSSRFLSSRIYRRYICICTYIYPRNVAFQVSIASLSLRHVRG